MFPPAAVSMRAVYLFWHNMFANMCKNLSLDCMVVISSSLFMLKELRRKGKGKLEVPFLSESEKVCMICYHSSLSCHPFLTGGVDMCF
jgi:hypothetical protein